MKDSNLVAKVAIGNEKNNKTLFLRQLHSKIRSGIYIIKQNILKIDGLELSFCLTLFAIWHKNLPPIFSCFGSHQFVKILYP
jgi:hypothetical protein